VATCPNHHRHRLAADLIAVAATFPLGICRSRRNATDNTFAIWENFCQEHHFDPTLAQYSDPLPLLQIFGHRYRQGEIAPNQSPVRGRTVGDALRAVGQTLAQLGHVDPRLTPSGKLDIRLSRQLSSYTRVDPPPARVKPIPIAILQQAATIARLSASPIPQAIADMLILGFYFLLRPGEYAATSNPEAAPFRLKSIKLYHHNRLLHPIHCALWELDGVTFVGLEFDTQKNGVRGEVIGLGRSGHHFFCPVLALLRRVSHLRLHRAPMDTPLYACYHHNTQHNVTTQHLTNILRSTVSSFGAHFGVLPSDISVRSLRSSGAMALLCAKVDTDRIRLLGRWRSDEMLRYLHVQAVPVVAPISAAMMRHGHFTLLPNRPSSPDLGAGG
jgi:hypothetical protein